MSLSYHQPPLPVFWSEAESVLLISKITIEHSSLKRQPPLCMCVWVCEAHLCPPRVVWSQSSGCSHWWQADGFSVPSSGCWPALPSVYSFMWCSLYSSLRHGSYELCRVGQMKPQSQTRFRKWGTPPSAAGGRHLIGSLSLYHRWLPGNRSHK